MFKNFLENQIKKSYSLTHEQRMRNVRISAIIGLSIGTVLIAIAFSFQTSLKKDLIETSGIVLEISYERPEYQWLSTRPYQHYIAKIEHLVEGKRVEGKLDVGQNRPNFQQGDIIKAFYKEKNPQKIFNETGRTENNIALLFMSYFMGTIMFCIGLWARYLYKQNIEPKSFSKIKTIILTTLVITLSFTFLYIVSKNSYNIEIIKSVNSNIERDFQ